MSMWEPRSSHLYVWTGLRVCEWFRVGAGHRVSVLVTDKWHRCAHQCVPRCVRVRPVRRSVPSSTCSCQCASKVCGLRDVCASVRPERTRAALTGAAAHSHVWAHVSVPSPGCSCAPTGTWERRASPLPLLARPCRVCVLLLPRGRPSRPPATALAGAERARCALWL